ncbi:hypothetical protein B9Z45_10975 [Limnohabitans sp. 2KL-17]|nr:hypothetical protein B9Z45_10975 [Limnohabitans sp. 2KL-17]
MKEDKNAMMVISIGTLIVHEPDWQFASRWAWRLAINFKFRLPRMRHPMAEAAVNGYLQAAAKWV